MRAGIRHPFMALVGTLWQVLEIGGLLEFALLGGSQWAGLGFEIALLGSAFEGDKRLLRVQKFT